MCIKYAVSWKMVVIMFNAPVQRAKWVRTKLLTCASLMNYYRCMTVQSGRQEIFFDGYITLKAIQRQKIVDIKYFVEIASCFFII